MDFLPMEKPLIDLSQKINELQLCLYKPTANQRDHETQGIQKEMSSLKVQFEALAREIYDQLSPYEITQLSRHPQRPYTLDVVQEICDEFIELQGDRNFMDDASIVGGLALFKGRRIVLIGHQKGRGTKENVKRNFGMPRPEGYRKALRLMSLAERFKLPIITFVDTPGAYPGMDAEERGQSEAIAKNIMVMFKLDVPIISVILGEGGSGGALAIGVGNKVLMMQYSVYSVISPEGCASILWKDAAQASRAAASLGITAPKALQLGIIDQIIDEPLGGMHWNPQLAYENLARVLEDQLNELCQLTPAQLRSQRAKKFQGMGLVEEPQTTHSDPTNPLDLSWSSIVKQMSC